VAIARALIHGPKLIVCDEPTSALDAETGHRVMEVLRDSALSSERALIIVTHDNRIFNFADRIARWKTAALSVWSPQSPIDRLLRLFRYVRRSWKFEIRSTKSETMTQIQMFENICAGSYFEN